VGNEGTNVGAARIGRHGQGAVGWQ
jgi:hypothetical protein